MTTFLKGLLFDSFMLETSAQEGCFKMEKDPDFVECVSSLPVQIDSFLSEQF
jgi:hypothetical protein